jgi:hypothetical protein
MTDEKAIREVVQPQRADEERGISESLVNIAIVAGGGGGLAAGVATVANTIHHWGDNQTANEPPPEVPHIELPLGVDLPTE